MDEKTIGVLGGGQLGRMLALEARRMGYRLVQWTGGDQSGAERLADEVIYGAFDDETALASFLDQVDVVTVEFENIPKELIETIANDKPIFPRAEAIAVCQDRELEKNFLKAHEIPTTPFRIVESAAELDQALSELSGDVIVKTARDGYDGKGQLALPMEDRPSAEEAWKHFEGRRAIVEKKVDLAGEISVMVVRGQDGEVVSYDPAENEHRNHILHLSIVPARLPESALQEAQEIARKVAEKLEYVGVIGVEFFINQDGQLLVNEMAPRPHNSGHHTLDACLTSQFEQQLRAVVGLPLGSTELMKPVVMWNLLGDLWKSANEQPDWSPVLSTAGARLHLYGKQSAKSQRKMGHVTICADSVEEALSKTQRCISSY